MPAFLDLTWISYWCNNTLNLASDFNKQAISSLHREDIPLHKCIFINLKNMSVKIWSNLLFFSIRHHSVKFQRDNVFSIFIIYDSWIYRWSGQKDNNSYNLPLFLTNSFGAFDFHQAAFKAFFVNGNFFRQIYIINSWISPYILWRYTLCFGYLRKTHWDEWYGIVIVPHFSTYRSNINKLLQN